MISPKNYVNALFPNITKSMRIRKTALHFHAEPFSIRCRSGLLHF